MQCDKVLQWHTMQCNIMLLTRQMQCNTIHCSNCCNAIHCDGIQCNTMPLARKIQQTQRCNAVQCNAVQCNAVQCSAIQCRWLGECIAILYSAAMQTQCNTMPLTRRMQSNTSLQCNNKMQHKRCNTIQCNEMHCNADLPITVRSILANIAGCWCNKKGYSGWCPRHELVRHFYIDTSRRAKFGQLERHFALLVRPSAPSISISCFVAQM